MTRGTALLSQWRHEGPADAGFGTVPMETRQVKAALKAMPVKTARRDGEGLARPLQMGWFRPVHCKSVSSQEMRALLTSRKSVLDALIDLELSLRGVLRNVGLKLGPVSKGRYEARVRELIAGNAMLEAAAGPILRARTDLRRGLAGPERLVRTLARQDAVCRLLVTMPGVGAIIALTFMPAIDDPGRFRRSKDVGPWVGLTPGRNQSGERDIVGAITKAGDAGLRAALYAASIAARWGVVCGHSGCLKLPGRLGFECKRPQGLPARTDEAGQAGFIEAHDELLNGLDDDEATHLPDLVFPEARPTAMLAERTFWEKATAIHVFCRSKSKV